MLLKESIWMIKGVCFVMKQSFQHLFFECVASKCMWEGISEKLNLSVGGEFSSIDQFWLSRNIFIVANNCTSACWVLWKLRNDLCFQRNAWKDMRILWQKMCIMISHWKILCPAVHLEELESKLKCLRELATMDG
jgi:hypothetical protein